MAILAFAVAAFGGVYPWAWGSATLVALLGNAAVAGGLAFRGERPAWSALWLPMAGFGAWVCLQWALGWAADGGSAATGILQLAGCAAVFGLAVEAFGRKEHAAAYARAAWFFVGALAVEALWQYGSGHRGFIYGFHDASYADPVGPFVDRDHFCACMELIWPLACVYTFRPVRRVYVEWLAWTARGLVPLLGLGVVLVSQSRAGAAVMTAEAALLLLLRPWRGYPPRARWALPAALSTLTIPALLWRWQGVATRVRAMLRSGSPFSRMTLWRAGWKMFTTHWLTGVGFNSFAAVYPAYQIADIGKLVDYAHSDYVQMLAETGIIGAAFAGAFLVLLLAFGFRRGARSRANAYRLAAMVGCAGFLLHAAVDFPFHIPADAFLFFSGAALASAGWWQEAGAGAPRAQADANEAGTDPRPQRPRG